MVKSIERDVNKIKFINSIVVNKYYISIFTTVLLIAIIIDGMICYVIHYQKLWAC